MGIIIFIEFGRIIRNVFEDNVWIIDVGVIYTTDEDEYGPMDEDVPNTFHQGWRNNDE